MSHLIEKQSDPALDEARDDYEVSDSGKQKPPAGDSQSQSATLKDAPVETTTPTPHPPPNGGFHAWLQVLGAFLLFFNSWGIVNTFGVYQSYYEERLLTGYSASSISWIGTVQGYLIFLISAVSGPIFDKGYIRSLISVGLFLVVFGLMMTSISTQYYQFFLAHGVCVGLGCGLLFLPSVAIVATYFTTRRALATGITASGGSIGSVLFPIIFHKLVGPIGFGWTTRIIAFIALAGLAVSVAVLKMRLPPPKHSRSLFDASALQEVPFMILNLSMFFALVGLYFPFFYLPSYLAFKLHNSSGLEFYIIAILNAASMFGRIITGLAADRFGSLNAMVPMSLFTTVMAFAWIGIRNLAGTTVFAILYGFVSGAMVSLPPTVIARLSPNMAIVGTRMGMSFTFGGFGLLIGNPIGGALLNFEEAVFWKAQLFSAMMLLTGTVLLAALRVLKWKQGEKGKF